ncbi:hypothetical protein [Lysinibacillus sphaericus]|uniref:hypothetical protein n=1 Tax=Lysinibacillus sphaericus TaxID=1421 RepID=UPI00056BCC3F|nr:hypothetical protein [Lysinibacillus sphaericus]
MKLTNTTGQLEFDNLIVDVSFPVNVAVVQVESGQGLLVRGSVLGKTAEQKVIFVGGETTATAEFVLATDIDTGNTPGSKVSAEVYVSGPFNREALIFNGDTGADAHELDLKKVGIYLKAVL